MPETASNRAFSTESLLLPLRWAVIAGITVDTWWTVGSSTPVVRWLILAAAFYNNLVHVLLRSSTRHQYLNYISPLVNGGLLIAGIFYTGSLESPYLPMLTLIFVAVALRQPPRAAIGMSTTLLVLLIATTLLNPLPPLQHQVRTIVIFALTNAVLMYMVAAFARSERSSAQQFLQLAAHELRNPMAGVKGLFSLTRTRVAQGRISEAPRLLEVAEKELDRLAYLVNELVDAYAADEGRLTREHIPLDLAALTVQAVQPYLAQENRIIELHLPADTEPVYVIGDASRLEQLIHNLTDNAVKYTGENGTIKIKLSKSGKVATLSVADNGIGIPASKLLRVFDRFYRVCNHTKVDPGGMGLGLYLCRQIVREHGGAIWAESREGAGTSLFVKLPLCTKPQ